MKIRILENSIRLRLTQPEVEQLRTTGKVKQMIKFAGSSDAHLTYALEANNEVSSIQAFYQGQEIIVTIPNAMAQSWASSNQISLQEMMPINEQEELKVLIEKDFKCLSVRAGEDESDMFPNPEQGKLDC